jgi:hypothetical protein
MNKATARSFLAPLASVVAYFVVRPWMHSDAAALAVAGAIPALYAIVAAVVWRRTEFIALLSAAAFALACVASLLAGGSSLPLKLHEAALAFVLGIVLLAAVAIRRPLPVSRVLKAPSDDERLGALIGAFLILHSLLQLALALNMSTAVYLTAGRVVGWAVLAAGAFGLWTYLRYLRRRAATAV